MIRLESDVDVSPKVADYRAYRHMRRRRWVHDAREDHLSWHFSMRQFHTSALWTPARIFLTVIITIDGSGRTHVVVEARSEHRRRPSGTPMHFDAGEPRRCAERLLRAICDNTVFPPDLVAMAANSPGQVLSEVAPRWDSIGTIPLEAVRGFWEVDPNGGLLGYRANALYHPEVWEDDEVGL